MPIININDAKIQLSELIDAAVHGEEIIIAKAGKPAARLLPFDATEFVPAPEQEIVRVPGSMKGRIWIADDFDAPLPEDIQAAFDGK